MSTTRSASFPVGRYACQLVLECTGKSAVLRAEWTPEKPENLDVHELAAYRIGRDCFLQSIADELGGTVAVVDL